MEGTIERKVDYYFAEFSDFNNQPIVDGFAVWKALVDVPWDAPPGNPKRLLPRGDRRNEGMDVRGWYREGHPPSVNGRIFKTRYTDFPLVGEHALDSPLELGSPTKGLRDVNHFVWYDLAALPELADVRQRPRSLLVLECNGRAPRASRIPKYFDDLFQGHMRITLAPLLDPDVWSQLSADGYRIQRFHGRVPVIQGQIPDNEGLLGIKAPGAFNNVAEIEIIIKPVRQRRESLLTMIRPATWRRILADTADQVGAIGASVTRLDGTTVDLRSTQLRSEIRIERLGDSQSVDPESAWRELRNVVSSSRSALGSYAGRRWDGIGDAAPPVAVGALPR